MQNGLQEVPEVAQEVVREQVEKLLAGASLQQYNQQWTTQHADISLRHRLSAAEMIAVLNPSQMSAAAELLLHAPTAALEGALMNPFLTACIHIHVNTHPLVDICPFCLGRGVVSPQCALDLHLECFCSLQ